MFIARKPLLTKKKEFSPEAKAVFLAWFARFSSEDGYMHP